MRSGIGKFFYYSVLFLGIFLGFRYLLPLCFPFLMGVGLALAAEPLVSLLHRRLRLPRGAGAAVGVSLAFGGVAGLILLLFALLFRELGLLSGVLPDLEEAVLSGLALLQNALLDLAARAPDGLGTLLQQNIRELFSGGTALLGEAGKYLLMLAGGFLTKIPDSFLTLGTALISGFMISAKLPRLKQWALDRLPRQQLRPLLEALRGLRTAVGGWLLAQVKLSGVSFLILTLGFIILKIPYAPLWALGTALLDALPVLGTGTVLLPWSLIALLQKDPARALGLLGIYTTVSLLRSVLEPRFLGRQLGLDPLAALAAIWVGYRLFGLGGMILAPLLTVTVTQILPHSGKSPG